MTATAWDAAAPRVDVVLCTNRDSPFLAETLASVRAQTYPYWNVILVDDGCPDPAHLAALTDGLPATIVRHAGRGVSAARNAGVARGDAPLVALLDDDDVWHPDKLLDQVAAVLADRCYVGSFTGGWYVDADGNTFGEGWDARPVGSTAFLSGAEPEPRIVTLLVTREVYDAVGGFDESFAMAEDIDFVLRVARAGPLACVPRKLVGYRRHTANASSPGSLEGRRAIYRLLAKQIAAASAVGDDELRLLLRAHRALRRRAWGAESVASVSRSLRQRNAAAVVSELRWVGKAAPLPFVRAGARHVRKLVGASWPVRGRGRGRGRGREQLSRRQGEGQR